MPSKASDREMQRLMADPRLATLSELERTGNDVLDLVSLTENQNSDILAWLFDAREGHGQGDEIFRDLLLHASISASNSNCLEKFEHTARFFKFWTPERIRTTSFGAAFCSRELGLQPGDRADLFVIDEKNELIIVIENKVGTNHKTEQLKRYRDSLVSAANKNRRIKNFRLAFLALDSQYEDDNHTAKACSDTWLHIGYNWLRTSANRALLHVKRGNSSAQLVVSYCSKCTDWDDPNARLRRQIAAQLHHSFPAAVERLGSFAAGRLESTWFDQDKGPGDPTMLFALQNKAIIRLFKETNGMAALTERLKPLLDHLKDENFDFGSKWLVVCPPSLTNLSSDEYWAAYLQVDSPDPGATEKSRRYDVSIRFRQGAFVSPELAQKVRAGLINIHPDFKRASNERGCRIKLHRSIGEAELLTAIKRRYYELEQILD